MSNRPTPLDPWSAIAHMGSKGPHGLLVGTNSNTYTFDTSFCEQYVLSAARLVHSSAFAKVKSMCCIALGPVGPVDPATAINKFSLCVFPPTSPMPLWCHLCLTCSGNARKSQRPRNVLHILDGRRRLLSIWLARGQHLLSGKFFKALAVLAWYWHSGLVLASISEV